MPVSPDLSLTAQLADTWRWWTSLGALLSIPLLWKWLAVQLATDEPIRFSRVAKIALAGALLCAMVGWVMAGVIIPLANDGRVAWFTREHFLYRPIVAASWLLWGGCAWLTATVLSRQDWPKMVAGAVVWWLACFFAAWETAGRALAG